MKPYILTQKVDAERFREVFQRRVPSDYFELDYDEVYGVARHNAYSLYVKTKPRSFRECIAEYLRIEIDSDGMVKCQYKPTIPAFLLAVFVPIFLLVIGTLLAIVMRDLTLASYCLTMAIIFVPFNCFKSKSIRQQLHDTVAQIADEAILS
jgi:hypothetical protein